MDFVSDNIAVLVRKILAIKISRNGLDGYVRAPKNLFTEKELDYMIEIDLDCSYDISSKETYIDIRISDLATLMRNCIWERHQKH